MNRNARAAINLDRAQRAVHAAERDWLVAYAAEERDVDAIRAAEIRVEDARADYEQALAAFDAQDAR